MIYRPQYQWPTPAGYVDIPFVRPVNFGQDVSTSLAPGAYLRDYVIEMDNDAPQLIRSLFWQGNQQGFPATSTTGSIQIQMRNAQGDYLTDGFIPLWLLFWGAGSTPTDGGSGRAKVFEPDLICPPGSVLILDYFNPDGGTFTTPGIMEFRGVKRFPAACDPPYKRCA